MEVVGNQLADGLPEGDFPGLGEVVVQVEEDLTQLEGLEEVETLVNLLLDLGEDSENIVFVLYPHAEGLDYGRNVMIAGITHVGH